MLHELVYLDGVVVLVRAVYGQAHRANQTTIFAVRVNTYKCGVLFVPMTIIWPYELLESLLKALQIGLYPRHFVIYLFSNANLLIKINFS